MISPLCMVLSSKHIRHQQEVKYDNLLIIVTGWYPNNISCRGSRNLSRSRTARSRSEVVPAVHRPQQVHPKVYGV